jgi:hypothetical protein
MNDCNEHITRAVGAAQVMKYWTHRSLPRATESTSNYYITNNEALIGANIGHLIAKLSISSNRGQLINLTRNTLACANDKNK